MEQTTPTILFKERQRFSSSLLLWVIALPSTIITWIFWMAAHKAPDGFRITLSWDVLVPVAVTLLLAGSLSGMWQDTEVRTNGIYARLAPFHTVSYSWEDVSKAYIRQYSPLTEYGGWGWRFGRNGQALTVSGSMGIQLQLKNGRRLLIGTQQPDFWWKQ